MLPLLLAACSVKVAVAVLAVLLALVARAVLEAVAQAAVVAVVVAAHTRPAMVALVEMAGHWYWSSEHEALCRG